MFMEDESSGEYYLTFTQSGFVFGGKLLEATPLVRLHHEIAYLGRYANQPVADVMRWPLRRFHLQIHATLHWVSAEGAPADG